MRTKRPRVVWIAAALVASYAWGAEGPADEPSSAGGSLLKGKIFATDGKQPVSGATVLIYHLSSEAAFTSPATDAKGSFEFQGVPYGYFDLAVRTADGLYVATQVINVPPSGKSVVVLTLRKFSEEAASADRRPFPGTEEPPVGRALLDEKLVGREFWRSRKGVAILSGAGATILLVLASGDDGSTVSPSTPN